MFDDNFEVFLADTEESKAIHYSIRYQVYCEEMGFENKEDFPLEQEFDEYDVNAAHFIVKHKNSGQWIGAMRLIFKNDQPLPLEKHCNLHAPLNKLISGHSVELSRLCLVKEIRRQFNDVAPPHGVADESEEIQETDKVKLLRSSQRLNRSIIWGLIRATLEYGYQNNIQNALFLTTNALAKVICKGGLEMVNIGEPCNHKGERLPFKMNVKKTYHNPIWKNDYKNGYQVFSQLSAPSKRSKARAA